MKRRRRDSPDKIREAAGGGWYERIPLPEKKPELPLRLFKKILEDGEALVEAHKKAITK